MDERQNTEQANPETDTRPTLRITFEREGSTAFEMEATNLNSGQYWLLSKILDNIGHATFQMEQQALAQKANSGLVRASAMPVPLNRAARRGN